MTGEQETKQAMVTGEQSTFVAETPIDYELGEIHATGLLRIRNYVRSAGAEMFGIERVPEERRTNQHPRSLFIIFFSANFTTIGLAFGALAPPVFGLGWWDSFCAIVFFNLLGAVWPALSARWGPKLGLRTLLVPRYSFGYYFSKFIALLNIMNQIGWGLVNSLSGASVLHDVGDGHLPLSVAVLLIGLASMIVAAFGYRVVHTYERYSWIAALISFIIIAGFGAKHFVDIPMGTGSVESASVLSFGTAIIGYELAWMPIMSDYGVYMRETISENQIFWYTYAGLLTSQITVELLGAAIGTLVFSSNPMFPDAYDARGIGGLIGSVFEGRGTGVRGFGKFIELVVAFSNVAVVITNIYSVGLSVQMVSKRLIVIPQLIWSLIGGAVLLVCGIVGRNRLESVMTNFLNVCAYWMVPFVTIVLLEHYIWRRHYEYDLSAWNDRHKLPTGWAAIVTFIIGTALAVICMSQVWWVGPIAAAIGGSEFGTDISWMLAFACTCALYIPLRHFERQGWKLRKGPRAAPRVHEMTATSAA